MFKHGESALAVAERWLWPVDQLDYSIRRWVIPVSFEPSRGGAPIPLFRESPPRKRSGGNGALNELFSGAQAAIGRCLRSEYDLAQPIPPRLVELLGQLEKV
jgi:hypothetical protein